MLLYNFFKVYDRVDNKGEKIYIYIYEVWIIGLLINSNIFKMIYPKYKCTMCAMLHKEFKKKTAEC